MKTQFEELLKNYQHNFTKEKHHSSIRNHLKNFETEQLIAFCEEQLNHKHFEDSPHNSNFLFKLIDYSARTDTYFEDQRNKLLNYSLAIGGFATTYITTMLGAYQKDYVAKSLFVTIIGFIIVLLGCISTWVIYILAFSPKLPHRKNSYSPYFFLYNVCKKFSFLSMSFIPTSDEKQQEALKAFHLDLVTYVNRINNLTADYSKGYISGLTQVLMMFQNSQHKSKSANLMRTILSITFSLGLMVYFVLLIRASFI